MSVDIVLLVYRKQVISLDKAEQKRWKDLERLDRKSVV